MYTNDRELTSTLYKVLYTVLTPISLTDDTLRTKRFLLFTSQLDERTRRAFQTFPARQVQSEKYLLAYLDAAEKYNGGVPETGDATSLEKRLDMVCHSVARMLGMEEGAAQRKTDLKKWAQGNDRRGFKLLRDLIDPDKDFKAWRKSQVFSKRKVTNFVERGDSKN